MKTFTKAILLFFALFLINEVNAQNNFWNDVSPTSLRSIIQKRMIVPNRYRTLSLDTNRMLAFLKSVPKEFTTASRTSPAVISIPMPDGLFQKFTIVESSMMEPGLAAMFPHIKTYSGQGIDDASATIKLDWTPLGFHAMIFSAAAGTFAIDPYAQKTLTRYIAYSKTELNPRSFVEDQDALLQKMQEGIVQQRTQATCAGTILRSYRLAVACTGEYAVAIGAATREDALAAIVTSINRVNGVYEKELSIRLILVVNNLKVVFINPATDRFTQNDNGSGLLAESQKVITDSIGTANFDIGHTFSTGAGGVAYLGVVCNNSLKAYGVTGLDQPVGDAYDIDYVAHEMGHQFSGNHTFNAVTGSCGGGNRNAGTAVEPGSGSTIMAYSGICAASNDLQIHSDPYFHTISFNEINTFVLAEGGSCAVPINTGNNPPVVNAGTNYTIPLSTPFMLTGSATDADDDVLTYSWEQIDLGPSGNWNSPTGNAPLFRSFAPTLSPTRIFPRDTSLVSNTLKIGEILPSYTRNMNFRLTARDNRSGGGGQCSDDVSITVANVGPFVVTYPNTAATLVAGEFQTITWNVANTNVAPVNSANVTISLSTDGGFTFPVTIVSSTPNDGSEEIRIPDNITTEARIRVMAADNIFFDISNANFTIEAAAVPGFIFNSPPPAVSCLGINPSATIKTSSQAGYNVPVMLSASGNPAGTTVVFDVNPVNTTGTVLVTLQGFVTPGLYNVTITGTSGSIVKTRVLQFQIGAPAQLTNIAPANNSTGVALTPTFTWQVATGSLYNLLISTSNAFTDTVQSVTGINTNSYTLNSPLAEDTKYFWRVTATNDCGSGVPSAGTAFITASVVCGDTIYSTNVPVTIPTTISTITSVLNIAAGTVIADVNVVGLKGTHTYVSDLAISLTSPAGTSTRLFSAICGSRDNFDINFDDEAAAGAIVCPPTGGQVRRPLQPLSVFDNQNSAGNWTLSVKDSATGDGGSLTSWGLSICTYAKAYTFIGNGSWTNADNWKHGLVPPLTLPPGDQIVIDPAAGTCNLDVPQIIAAGGRFTVMPGKTFVVNVSLTFQ